MTATRILFIFVVGFLVIYLMSSQMYLMPNRRLMIDLTSGMSRQEPHSAPLSLFAGNQDNNPHNISASPVPNQTRRILYFAVTHHSIINSRLDACLNTWCARILAHTGQKVIWYSNTKDPRIDHVISIDNADLYKDITWRMLAIWRHVYDTYPGYSWYARLWDDTIVFPETFELLVEKEDPEQLLEIGRLAYENTGGLIPPGVDSRITQSDRVFLDGGAGSLISQAALHVFVSNLDRCAAWMRDSLAREITCAFACEDVLLSACKHRLLNIRFKRGLGLYHTTPPALPLSDHQLQRDVQADPENTGFLSITRSMHYAPPDAMRRIDKIWYKAQENTGGSSLPPPAAKCAFEGPLEMAAQASHGGEPITLLSPSHVLGTPRLVYDLITFNDELDMLELRMIELAPVVDFFVINEQPVTYTGKPKPLHYQLNQDRFARFRAQILVVNHSVPDTGADVWGRERMSRVVGLQHVKEVAPKDALVLFTDVDEVPTCWTMYVLKHTKSFPSYTFVHLAMQLYYYNLRWRAEDSFSNSRVFVSSLLDSYTPLESLFNDGNTHHYSISNAGWHCSYCMNVSAIVNKLVSFSHTEYSGPPFTDPEHISRCMETGMDLFLRQKRFFWNDMDQIAGARTPYALALMPDRFAQFRPEEIH